MVAYKYEVAARGDTKVKCKYLIVFTFTYHFQTLVMNNSKKQQQHFCTIKDDRGNLLLFSVYGHQ